MATHGQRHAIPHDTDGELPSGEAEYYEISTTQAIPTKTGNEAPTSDGLSIDERPFSAGSFTSAALEVDDSQEDEALLAANRATPVPETVPAYEFPTGGFKRPDAAAMLADAADAADAAFSGAIHPSTEHARPPEDDVTYHDQPEEPDTARSEEFAEHASDDVQVVEGSSAPPLHHISSRPAAVQKPIRSWSTWRPRNIQYIDRRRRKKSKRRDQLQKAAAQAPIQYPMQPAVPLPTVPAATPAVELGNYDESHDALSHHVAGEEAYQPEHEDSGSAKVQQSEVVTTQHDGNRDLRHQHSTTAQTPGERQKDLWRDEIYRRDHRHEAPITPPRSHPSRNTATILSSPSYADIHDDAARKMREKDKRHKALIARYEEAEKLQAEKTDVEKRELEKKLRSQYSADLNALKKNKDEELAAATGANEQLRQDLEEADQEKTGLSQEVKDLRKKVNGARTLQKFMEGLGRDFEELKNDTRRLSTTAIEDSREFDERHKALTNELRDGHAREALLSANVRESAALFREADIKFKQAAKDRTVEQERREMAENQLSAMIQSNEEVQRAIRSSSGQILSQLSTIHTMVGESKNDNTISEMLQQAKKDIQDIESSTADSADRVTAVRDSIEKLVDKFDQYADCHQKAEGDEVLGLEDVQAHLDQSLTKLKQDLWQTEQLLEQDAEHRETISTLREQLKAAQLRSDDTASQVTAARKIENELKQNNATLQLQLSALKSTSTPVQEAQVQLNHVNTELETVKQALQTTEAELASKAEELCVLGPANTQLAEQLQVLQTSLGELQTRAADFGREREELRQEARDNEQSVRKEMREHLEKVELHLQAETRNDLKKLQSERNRLNDHVKSLQNDLDSSNGRLNQLQQDRSQDVQSKQELDRTKKHIESQKQEIETLKASLAKVQNALKSDETLKEQHATISAQLSVDRSKLEAAQAELSELKGKCAQGEVSLKSSEKNATEAKEDAQRTRAGLEHYKASCEKAIDDATMEGERRAEALQKSLAEAQAELEAAKAAGATFRTEVENSWKQEQESYDERIIELRQKLAEIEQQRSEAQTNVDQIRSKTNAIEAERNAFNEQLSEMTRRAEVAEASVMEIQASTQLLNETRQRAEVAEADLEAAKASLETLRSATAWRPPPASTGPNEITPNTTFRAVQPTKPRKILDRSTGLVSEVGRIPTPEILRPESRRTGSAGSRHEPHQLYRDEDQPMLDAHELQRFGDMESMRSSLSPGGDPILKIRGETFSRAPSIVEETQLNTASQSRADAFSRPSAVVEETQFDFGSNSSGRAGPYLPSVVEETQLEDSYITRSAGKGWPLPSQGEHNKRHSGKIDFTIHEDSGERDGLLGSQDLKEHGQLRDTLSWTQAERNMYTFQKPVANPNSASKRGPAPAMTSSNVRRSASYGTNSGNPGFNRADTPHQQNMLNRNGSNLSSSPHFVQDSQIARKQNTYQAAGSSTAKRKLSRTNSKIITDPRLAGRNAPAPMQKRAGEGQPAGASAPATKRQALANLPVDLSGAPPKNSSSQFLSMLLEPPRSSQDSSNNARNSSHMRTLAGKSTRQTRSAKRMSKDDEISARFSQELSQPSRQR